MKNWEKLLQGNATCKYGCQGKLQQTEGKSIWKCKKQPFSLHFREWPWRELSASSIVFCSLWNTEITKHWLKMAVSFVLPGTAKGLGEVFTGSSSANGCWVVLTFQKKPQTSCLQVHPKWRVDWLGSKRNYGCKCVWEIIIQITTSSSDSCLIEYWKER